ncbi:MAG: dihydroorotate dehydrogenase-like protein [Tropicimonas sp.]|uniref:dihydroorotate dehydrogenase-like protein n=1 Tax=Tropicimonas sp. TaxID=2067044 RepID=UPI003A8B66AB
MDLSTQYLGLTLPSPVVASAGPYNAEVANLLKLEAQGAGAVVLPSVFEEQVQRDQEILDALVDHGAESTGEALSFFPSHITEGFDTARQLTLVEEASKALSIPVIASLNGITDSGWIDYAREFEAAGAAAIELNIFLIPSEPGITGAQVEARYEAVVRAVASAVSIPVAVKIGPYFSSPGAMAQQLVGAGAKGLVLFNRFYQPDINPATLGIEPSLRLSSRHESRLPLLWIGVLAGRVPASLAATTGVETADDVVKFLLAGADVVMTTSAILRHGVEHMGTLVEGLREWLGARGVESPDAIRGRLSHRLIKNPEAYERANYIRVLQGYQRH